MFSMKGYRIVETKEEFLKKWSPTWWRYDNKLMPGNFSIDTATFPMALHYIEDWEHWSYYPFEETKNIILEAYQEKIDFFTKRIQELKLFNEG